MLVTITVILRRFLAESADHFWQPAEFENVTNSYLENLTHLQNPGHLSLTAPSIERDNLKVEPLHNHYKLHDG